MQPVLYNERIWRNTRLGPQKALSHSLWTDTSLLPPAATPFSQAASQGAITHCLPRFSEAGHQLQDTLGHKLTLLSVVSFPSQHAEPPPSFTSSQHLTKLLPFQPQSLRPLGRLHSRLSQEAVESIGPCHWIACCPSRLCVLTACTTTFLVLFCPCAEDPLNPSLQLSLGITVDHSFLLIPFALVRRHPGIAWCLVHPQAGGFQIWNPDPDCSPETQATYAAVFWTSLRGLRCWGYFELRSSKYDLINFPKSFPPHCIIYLFKNYICWGDIG